MEIPRIIQAAIFQAAKVNHSRLQISWTICISFTRSLIIIQPLARIYEFGYISQTVYFSFAFYVKISKNKKKVASLKKTHNLLAKSVESSYTGNIYPFQKLLIDDKKARKNRYQLFVDSG